MLLQCARRMRDHPEYSMENYSAPACEVGGDMDQLRLTVCTLAGGYVSLHKAKVEPLMATLRQDPFLSDMSKKRPSVKEIETLIGVGKPIAMMLCIRKLDGTKLDVAVLNTASVRDLKVAIRKKVEEGTLGQIHISWELVWGYFCLVFEDQNLLDDSSSLREFGIKNGDEITYAHHIASLDAGYHLNRRKRGFLHGLRKTFTLK